MGLRFMEHILILTDEPEKTRDWWVNNLGFRDGDHPEFGFPVYWLYIGNQDVIHIGKKNYSAHQDTYIKAPDKEKKLGSAAGSDAMTGSGRIDHVCFNCEGLEEFIERLDDNGVEFSERQVNDGALYQLFMVEPINGIKIELNFAASEAERINRKPSYTGKGAAQDASAAY